MRGFLLALAVLAALYWYWQRQQQPDDIIAPAPPRATSTARIPDRPGGGLNPFVVTDDHAAPAQRPRVPAIPQR